MYASVTLVKATNAGVRHVGHEIASKSRPPSTRKGLQGKKIYKACLSGQSLLHPTACEGVNVRHTLGVRAIVVNG